mgnify:CR=1 FL=1
MKLVAVLLLLVVIVPAFPEAAVVEEGTRLESPDGSFVILAAPHFLLSREDLEEPVLALELVPRLEADAARQKTTSTLVLVVVPVVSFLLGFLVKGALD